MDDADWIDPTYSSGATRLKAATVELVVKQLSNSAVPRGFGAGAQPDGHALVAADLGGAGTGLERLKIEV